MDFRRNPPKMKNGGGQATLVVCTARILAYNCLDAPYQPAGGLPDRYERCPTGGIGNPSTIAVDVSM